MIDTNDCIEAIIKFGSGALDDDADKRAATVELLGRFEAARRAPSMLSAPLSHRLGLGLGLRSSRLRHRLHRKLASPPPLILLSLRNLSTMDLSKTFCFLSC